MSHAFAGVAILLLPLANPDTALLKGAWEMISDKTNYVKAYTENHPITSPAYPVFDGQQRTSGQGNQTEELPTPRSPSRQTPRTRSGPVSATSHPRRASSQAGRGTTRSRATN